MEGFEERSCPQIAEGKAVAVGVHKAACAVEGPRGRGATSVGVIIDSEFSLFWVLTWFWGKEIFLICVVKLT